jgi:hypothetical protein
MKNKLFYSKTRTEVKLGDRILFKKFFKSVEGQVVYLPGQSPSNKAFGDDTWAIQLDDESGDVRSMLYAPQQEPFAHSKISFQKRGTADKAVTPDEDIV